MRGNSNNFSCVVVNSLLWNPKLMKNLKYIPVVEGSHISRRQSQLYVTKTEKLSGVFSSTLQKHGIAIFLSAGSQLCDRLATSSQPCLGSFNGHYGEVFSSVKEWRLVLEELSRWYPGVSQGLEAFGVSATKISQSLVLLISSSNKWCLSDTLLQNIYAVVWEVCMNFLSLIIGWLWGANELSEFLRLLQGRSRGWVTSRWSWR